MENEPSVPPVPLPHVLTSTRVPIFEIFDLNLRKIIRVIR